jgi:hypothetical protein
MTSSFSTMLLTAAVFFDTTLPADQTPKRLATLADTLQALLPTFTKAAQTARAPQRAVFVGSGPLAFAAREAALKVMELAAGQIPALWDSTLGFRHGPKSFTVGETDIWLFRSAAPHTRAYDDDLLAELRTQFPASHITAPEVPQPHGDLWSAPLYVALAQVHAVTWSDALGLNVDDPFAGQGTLTRVVSGVRLHPGDNMIAAGIDLGGTKIEAQVFAPDWSLQAPQPVAHAQGLPRPRRGPGRGGPLGARPTETALSASLPRGSSTRRPAWPSPPTSLLPANPSPADVTRAAGRKIAWINDCRALTLSEAMLGAAQGADPAVGLILGTGVAGGVVTGGKLLPSPAQTGGEFGHFPLAAPRSSPTAFPSSPAAAAARDASRPTSRPPASPALPPI